MSCASRKVCSNKRYQLAVKEVSVLEKIAVEVRDVVKRFGEVVAVDHVSLQIQDGEFFGSTWNCGKRVRCDHVQPKPEAGNL